MTVRRALQQFSALTSLAVGSFICLIGQVAAASPAAHEPVGHEAAEVASEAVHASEHVVHHHGITWFNWPNPEDHRVGLAYLLINFLVLAFLLHRLIIRKLVADNAARHDAIKAQVTAAQQAMSEAESVLTEYKRRVDRLDQETREILEQARVGAEADRQRLLTEARAEVERFKAQAMAAAQREVALRKQAVENEVLDRAIARAEELLRARFTDADQARLVDDYAVEVVNGRPAA
ncbi:FoF1-type ATP synthase, membrane subunit b or b' [Nannocystis exedens]|uniref:ATP synthase subunit b n=1 Tax=Nannocystis exedens TaxID=54 RepID=A0A1I1SMC7_9BACT|nr:ATP synthase subunit b, sodium ion specific [Nannocystis exedens]SFD47596.1 FoF1-type ATP synthase, membrane subunit b or b' [Nannocystis exedens]